jgi:hypothetical protein
MARDSETSRDRQPGSLLKLDPSQSEKGRDRYVRTFSFLAPVTQKRLILVNQAPGDLWPLVFVMFFARPPALVVWWGRLRQGSLCGVRAPPGASAIARSLPGRRDPACTLVSAVTVP